MEETIMNSLPDGYRAIVFGASGGIGSAFFEAFETDPRCRDVTGLSRTHNGFDITDEATIEDHARKLSGISFDVMICATGCLSHDGKGPEKTIRHIEPQTMAAIFAVNTIGPALVMKHFVPLLPIKTRSVFASLSARVGSIGDNRLGGWISYRAAKAGLNQIIRTTAIEVARTRPQAVVTALHPGTVETSLSEAFAGNRERQKPQQSVRQMLNTLNRLTPHMSGNFYAYDGSIIEW